MKFKCRCTWMYVKENLLVPNCRVYYSDFEWNIYIYIKMEVVLNHVCMLS